MQLYTEVTGSHLWVQYQFPVIYVSVGATTLPDDELMFHELQR